MNWAYEALRTAVVTTRMARRLDGAGDGGIRDDPPVPNPLDELVPRDQAVAIFDDEPQQREDLRFDRDRNAVGPKLDICSIQFKIFEKIDHREAL
jgi:hypothetical protein